MEPLAAHRGPSRYSKVDDATAGADPAAASWRVHLCDHQWSLLTRLGPHSVALVTLRRGPLWEIKNSFLLNPESEPRKLTKRAFWLNCDFVAVSEE